MVVIYKSCVGPSYSYQSVMHPDPKTVPLSQTL